MKKILLIIGIIVAAGVIITPLYIRSKDKALSPEGKVVYETGQHHLIVFYSRPYKKDRLIFGGLVPYDQVWRTGANEATVFSTDEDIHINGKLLRSGRYQLLTIPHEDHWTIIFNSDIPGWGINLQTGEVYHNKRADVLITEVPVTKKTSSVEQFTISIGETDAKVNLALEWDDVQVVVPIELR
ncbi:MAG: DUF2911 domain-containing protein [Cyclobacteriaceae bacterium]|nr:DUF2911 domain-containing protein [Cyclobacteriaceae bacterium]